MLAGVGYANTIFDLVFFISVLSVLLQGTTLGLMAKWLHVSVPEKLRRKFPLDIELSDDFKSELIELDISESSPSKGKAVVELGLPKTALIVMIYRHGKYLTASGDTVIEAGDHLLIMADTKETVSKVRESFGI
jgi:cell volume regulation protein A